MKIYFYWVLFFLGITHEAAAQSSNIVSDQVSQLNISENSEVFQDVSKRMPFKEVVKQNFEPHHYKLYQYSFSSNVFWFRFRINNKSSLDHWYFLWSDALNDHVDVYVPTAKGTYRVLRGGMLALPSEKAYKGLFPLFNLGVLPQDSTQVYYLRLQASEPINSQLTLLTHQAFIDRMPTTLAMVWLVIGIQLLRVLYNIILARYIRNTSFRWYSFHTIIVTLSVLGSFGVTASIFSEMPSLAAFLNSAFYQLMPATYTLFIYSLLNIPQNYPRLKGAFFLLVSCSILQVAAHLIVPRMYLLIFNNYLFLLTEFFLIGISLYSLAKRLPVNFYLLIPCFFTLVPFIFLNLRALGVIHYDWIYPMIYITNFLEILALALVLGKIIEATDREKLKTEKALLAEKLEAEKLHELDVLKSRFFTNISHEFRTPLTLLVGPLNDFRKKYPSERIIPSMLRNVERLQTLISQLLDLAKLESKQLKVEMQQGDISFFFRYLFSSFESLAHNRQIIYTYQQSHGSFEGYFDADKVEKIVTNLLSNAFKFTPSGGRIEALVMFDNQHFVLQISDSGIGIEQSQIPRIFERFYQADEGAGRKYEGSGVGLALVKEQVEVLKGNISVVSELGKGTSFKITIPIDFETWKNNIIDSEIRPELILRSRLVEDREETFNQPKSKSSTLPLLLVVEDNPDLQLYISLIFEKKFQIEGVLNGKEGLERAFEMIPDLVICDLMMPYLDGISFCKELKADTRTNHIPVVMLTAKATLEDRLEGFESGADEYITKPFNREELEKRVENLVKQRDLLQQKYSLQLGSETAMPDLTSKVTVESLFLQKAVEVVERHLGESKFDVEQFCREMGMSRTNMHRKMKALTQQSTTEFIRLIRLKKAAQIFRESGGRVSDVAMLVGFESLSYFSKSFQEQFGISPSEYIIQHHS